METQAKTQKKLKSQERKLFSLENLGNLGKTQKKNKEKETKN